MDFLDFIDQKVSDKIILNEAATVDSVKEVFKALSLANRRLADAFDHMAECKNIHGDGDVPGDIAKVESALKEARKLIKGISANKKDAVEFNTKVKTTLGTITASYRNLQDKLAKTLPGMVDGLEVEPSTQMDTMFKSDDEVEDDSSDDKLEIDNGSQESDEEIDTVQKFRRR